MSLHTVAALRRQGQDVVTSRELEQERAPDYRLLFAAADQLRVFVTHDEEDFRLLHGAWLAWSAAWRATAQHGGILVIPQWGPGSELWGSVHAARELTEFVGQSDSLA